MTRTDDSGAFDLTTEAGVEAYLAGTPFSCTKAEALSGGLGNYVFRLHLGKPHNGRSTLVLKHAQPYVKALPSVPFDIQRQFFEVSALRKIREWSPSTDFVTVPTVYEFDQTAHTIIMDDCGPTAVTLKEYLQQGRCTIEAAHRIGKNVGEFLGKLHLWGKRDAAVSDFFSGNMQAKQLSSWVTYGRVLPTFEEGLEKLCDPAVRLGEEELPLIKMICEKTADSIRTAKDSLVMGDFWPGNLMLSCDDAGEITQIRIIDWEICRPGLFGVELGQFCAELHLLTRFNEDVCQGTPKVILEDFLGEYAMYIEPNPEMCRQTIVHLGAHLVAFTPRIEWGGKEMTQNVVKEGVQLMKEGYSAQEDWLRSSVIGIMVTKIP